VGVTIGVSLLEFSQDSKNSGHSLQNCREMALTGI